MDETAKTQLLESLGLTWNALSGSKGDSALSKFDTILNKLIDTGTPNETKLIISTAIISLISTATPDSIQTTLNTHMALLFKYLIPLVKTIEDKERQTIGNYLLSFVQIQIKNAVAAPAFTTKMGAEVTKILKELKQTIPTLKEKDMNDPDEPIHTRTESIKLLVKCIQPMDDVATLAAMPVLMEMLTIVEKEKKTPMLRSALLEFVIAVHDRKPSLLTSYMGILVDAMQQGDFPLTLSQLADSFAVYARSNAGALKLSNLVSAIVKEPTFASANSQTDEKSQTRTKSLLSLLLRIATVKPSAVSKYVNVCVQSCAPSGNTALVGFVIPIAKLVAATSLAGVDESYYSLETLCRLLRTYKYHEFTMEEQRVLLGAIDVAKNKCPKGDIFAEDTLETLTAMAGAHTRAYANIIKWNGGKWAIEADMVEFLSFTADEWGQDGVGGDSSGSGCLGRLVQVLSGSGGAGGGGGDEIINPMGGKKTTNDSGKAAPSSPLFVSKQVAPAENSPIPQARLLGSPSVRVAPEVQPPVPLAGGGGSSFSTPGPAGGTGNLPTPPPGALQTPAKALLEDEQLSAARSRVAALEAQL